VQLIPVLSTVPLSTRRQSENASTIERSPAPVQELKHPTVLVVDDNDVVSEFLSATLCAYGYDTLLASNRDQAIEHCRRHGEGIHALIADVRLGAQDGFESARLLQTFCPSVKIVLISGYPYEHLVRSGLLPVDSNIGTFLQKPFALQEILELIKPVETVS